MALSEAQPAMTTALSLLHGSMTRLHDSCRTHIDVITSECRSPMENILALEADLSEWLVVIERRPEAEQLRSAHKDFGLAFYAVSCGLYRQAFSSLRSFLEVSIAAIYMSAFEMKRRQWVDGKIDISWSGMNSDDDGIYSSAYVSVFCPAALGERVEMREALRKAYRRCSEYIHGNVITSSLLPESIRYDREVSMEWIRLAELTLRTLIHSLMVRYFGEFDSDERHRVEAVLEEHFLHLSSVRTLLGLPVEDAAI